jgi:hypothetical protein
MASISRNVLLLLPLTHAREVSVNAASPDSVKDIAAALAPGAEVIPAAVTTSNTAAGQLIASDIAIQLGQRRAEHAARSGPVTLKEAPDDNNSVPLLKMTA